MLKFLTPVLTLALLTLTSCGDSASSYTGTWVADGSKILSLNPELVPADAPPEGKKMMEEMFAKMEASMTLKDDGTVTGTSKQPGMMGGEPKTETTSGTWKFENGELSITMKNPDGKEQTATGKMDGDTLVMSMTDEGKTIKMPFTRK